MKGTAAERRRSLGRARVRRHEERAWAKRSGQVFTHRVDPAQLRAEQVAKAIADDPEVLDLVKPEIAQMLQASLRRAAASRPA